MSSRVRCVVSSLWRAVSTASTTLLFVFSPCILFLRRNKHDRPATLVIDDVQKLAREKPEFLLQLQEFAKKAADSGHLRVVFVSSDFTVLTLLQQKSDWSRCDDPLEVGESDISEAAAVEHLLARLTTEDSPKRWERTDSNKALAGQYSALLPLVNILSHCLQCSECHRCCVFVVVCLQCSLPWLPAEYIVKNITGTRFALLNRVKAERDNLDKVKAWENQLHVKTQMTLARNGIPAGHSLFARMLDAPGQRLTWVQLHLGEGCVSEAQVAALVKAHVLAAHPDETFTCAARHVVAAFEQLRRMPLASSAPVAAPDAASAHRSVA